MNEIDAVIELTAAGDADRAAATILAMDVASPWASERKSIRDYPDRPAPRNERPLFELLDKIGPNLTDTSDTLAAFLRYHQLAAPVADLRGPHWLTDPALDGAWVPLPPRGWLADLDDRALTLDGRLAALAALANPRRRSPDAPRAGDAVEVLVRWIAYANWSTESNDQCANLKVDWRAPGRREWWQRRVTDKDLAKLVWLVSRPSTYLEEWTRPDPTPEEIEREQERERNTRAREAYAALAASAPRTKSTELIRGMP